ncbi:AbrB/MazE/SpoVT family DNA-binding domain-containing protein [Brucepastera parasyntrophica]|uniref:AbrB/MazE/SpoVT family DNA-binding domain-containing protein n=1 Tax=Brucepastera parasyntrophica TaxID=2880008 RepID=UPI00210DA6AF|nr:AbrB/MazE/SpoVT family DNA-binding domain-containing protein [Brucepastera parasyntrophica]ULQ60664.1 AbrB/MazE/SpoVT family DNA-binding domain-containing protein [Brucepastera parasyntrophica]
MANRKTARGRKHAWMVKMGEKGQIVIPKEAREIFNLNPGDTIILLGDEERGIAIDTSADLAVMYDRIFGGTSDRYPKKQGR